MKTLFKISLIFSLLYITVLPQEVNIDRGFSNLSNSSSIDYLIKKTNNTDSQIEVLAPNGGEKILAKSRFNILWDGEPYRDIKIEMTLDSSRNWMGINISGYGDYSAAWKVPDTNSGFCKIRIIDLDDSTNYDESEDYFTISPDKKTSYNFISANECLMWIGNDGMSAHNPLSDWAGFYWPGGIDAENSSIFADGILWGGIHNGMIKVNGSTYRYGLTPGIILPHGESDDPLDPKYKVYKIKKNWEQLPEGEEKESYREDYENWPGDQGAPFIDVNQDGKFTKGIDEPHFEGDQVLFYVSNDLDTVYTEYVYGSYPIGLEFQQTLFAHNTPELENAVFKRIVLINKSTSPIDSMYISYWSDDDLGFAGDDLIGFDTNLNLGYSYNGDNFDEDYFGTPPPAVGHLLLQGPIVEAEPIDSAKFFNKYLKGYKNLPLTSSHYYESGSQLYVDPALGDYEGTLMIYNQMSGKYWDGSLIIDPVTNDTTVFMLDGDPVNEIGWYDGDGWPGGRSSGDRRYLMSSGPVTMAPGDTQEVVYAILMARGSDNIQSVAELKKSARFLHEFYGNEIPVGVEEKENKIVPKRFSLSQNYPNPFNPSTKIEYTIPKEVRVQRSEVSLIIYDILGRKVETLVDGIQKPGYYEVEFDGSNYASGMYFYRLNVYPAHGGAGDYTNVKKMMLLK